jgi:signal transduction histidine kinase
MPRRRTSEPVRRRSPALLVVLFVALATINVASSWMLFRHLSQDAERSSRLFGQILAALNDPRPGAETEALFDLASRVREFGIPVVITDPEGRVTAADNLPFEAPLTDPRVLEYSRRLDRAKPPFVQEGIGIVHYGSLPVSGRLKVVFAMEIAALVLIVAVAARAAGAVRASGRDRLWVAMARETAHQMGTPLMSLAGWIEHLREMPAPARTVGEHLEADLDYLQRVAQRFERMGRATRIEPVGLGTLVERVAAYSRTRLPRLAHRIDLSVEADGPGPVVRGDRVLLEWALEALVRNAVDALSGRGGRVTLRVETDGKTGRVRVMDDGPGVPVEVRSALFEPGVTTKTGGWGIGLALADRIVTDQHGGALLLEPSEHGAVFCLELPVESQ